MCLSVHKLIHHLLVLSSGPQAFLLNTHTNLHEIHSCQLGWQRQHAWIVIPERGMFVECTPDGLFLCVFVLLRLFFVWWNQVETPEWLSFSGGTWPGWSFAPVNWRTKKWLTACIPAKKVWMCSCRRRWRRLSRWGQECAEVRWRATVCGKTLSCYVKGYVCVDKGRLLEVFMLINRNITTFCVFPF